MAKRKALADENDNPRKYAALKPRVYRVATAMVRKRWTTLPEASQNKVQEILQSGQRPAIMKHREEKRRLEAQEVISSVQTSFAQRIPRIPFPPGTKESHFDYESVIGLNRTAEAQLTSTTHYNQLLRSEIERRKARLAAEKREFEKLERNAKAEEGLRKRQIRMLHPLLKDADISLHRQGLRKDSKSSLIVLEDDADPTIKHLTQQLLSHLESMQSNIGQLDQIKNALPRSKAILEDLIS